MGENMNVQIRGTAITKALIKEALNRRKYNEKTRNKLCANMRYKNTGLTQNIAMVRAEATTSHLACLFLRNKNIDAK
jgi:hypothetical protein